MRLEEKLQQVVGGFFFENSQQKFSVQEYICCFMLKQSSRLVCLKSVLKTVCLEVGTLT